MSLKAKGCGVDLILDDQLKAPSCQHGPTLLFEKFGGANKEGRKFYACSAFRDRKDCNFYQWADESVAEEKLLLREKRFQSLVSTFSKQRLAKLCKLSPQDRSFCHTCGRFLLPSDDSQHDKTHKVISPVEDECLQRPSQLFQPRENNKTFAQYLFSESSVKFTVNLIKTLGFNKVLCLGAPRIHEEIQAMRESSSEKLQSFLLDLDDRFTQIWPPHLYANYNMFNHHFFGGGKAKECFTSFVGGCAEKFVVVMDPPFGGRCEALANTLHKISSIWNNTKSTLCPVLWFFPYFMEKRMVEICPSLKMLDYKVDYDNHSLFHKGEKGRKDGSPVRIFTNLPSHKVALPKSEGYWFCKRCNGYSSSENWHCERCKDCTSKDGKRYVHCEPCGRCVKPSRAHCVTCNQCQLPDHVCGQANTGCHICGKEGHKRKECPAKLEKTNKKRKSKDNRKFVKNKKKKSL